MTQEEKEESKPWAEQVAQAFGLPFYLYAAHYGEHARQWHLVRLDVPSEDCEARVTEIAMWQALMRCYDTLALTKYFVAKIYDQIR